MENPWTQTAGAPIRDEEAWMLFETWRTGGKQIGTMFCGRSAGTVICGTMRVRSARNGTVTMGGDGAAASFNLKQAKFTYGPLQAFPNWPAGPPVDVQAMQVYLATGDWLVLAEGTLPQGLAPLSLPM